MVEKRRCHGKIGDKTPDPSLPSIITALREALPFKCISCALILIDCLTLNFAPIHIAAIVSIAYDKITT